MKPGDQFNFRFTDQQTAEELFIKQQQHLLQLQNAQIQIRTVIELIRLPIKF
jgi:hypothetical protein